MISNSYSLNTPNPVQQPPSLRTPTRDELITAIFQYELYLLKLQDIFPYLQAFEGFNVPENSFSSILGRQKDAPPWPGRQYTSGSMSCNEARERFKEIVGIPRDPIDLTARAKACVRRWQGRRPQRPLRTDDHALETAIITPESTLVPSRAPTTFLTEEIARFILRERLFLQPQHEAVKRISEVLGRTIPYTTLSHAFSMRNPHLSIRWPGGAYQAGRISSEQAEENFRKKIAPLP